MNKAKSLGNRPTLGGMILQHIIVFLICIVFPGLVTASVPASWIRFDRQDDTVRCKVWTCVYFVIPYKIQSVDQVSAIGQRENAGRTERQRRFGRTTDQNVDIQGEGFLQIFGSADHVAEVSVSPASLEGVVRKSNDFLTSNDRKSKTIFVIANWKFGGLMGGTLTLFTILYVVGYTLSFLMFAAKCMKRTFRE